MGCQLVVAGTAKVSRPTSCAPSIARESTRSANAVQIRNRRDHTSVPVVSHGNRSTMTARALMDLTDPASPGACSPPPGLSQPVLVFNQAISRTSGQVSQFPPVRQSFWPKACSPDTASGAELPVLAVRRQTDVLFESAQLGRSVFEEHLLASRCSKAEANALWWHQRCLEIERRQSAR